MTTASIVFPSPGAAARCLLASAVLLLVASSAPAVDDATAKCSRAIDRAALQFESRVHKALAGCAIRTKSGRPCDAGRRDAALAKARTALDSRLAAGCGEADPGELGFPGECDDADGAPFSAADLGSCIAFTHRAAIDAAIALEFPPADATTDVEAVRCQRGIGRAAMVFVKNDLAARQRCLAESADPGCRSEGAATGDPATDTALVEGSEDLAHRLGRDCGGVALEVLGFPGDCSDTNGAPFDAADLVACVSSTHDAIARAMLDAEHPAGATTTTTIATTTTTSSTSTTITTTTTTLPSFDSLAALVAPYGDADGDGFANNVELAACSNPADAASTPVNDASLCANQTVFSDTLGPAWGSTDRLTDPTYDAAVAALVAQNALDCSLYCATTPNIGSPQACEGAWPWSGVPEYGHYTSGRTVEVNFPDEDGNRLEGRMFLPPGVSCSPAVPAPVCDGVTDAVSCTDAEGRTYPAVAISDGFVGVQRMYYWAAHRLAEHGYITLAFDVSGQGLSQGAFPNGDAGIAGDIPGGGGGFARDIGAAMNFLAGADNPVRNLIRVDPAVIVNQATGGADHLEPYVLGLAGHSAGATAAIAYQQSTEAAYPVRARAVVAWSHFDAEGTIGNVAVQLHSGDEDNGFIQPPGSGNRGPEMERRYDRLGGDRNLDGTMDFTPQERQIVMTSAGTHLDYSKVPWAYTPTWAEELEYHYTLAWFDRHLGGDLRRRMGGVVAGVIQEVDRYADYAPCDTGDDCFSAAERLRMGHVNLSDVWCSRYDVGGIADEDMKGAGCVTQ